MKTIQQPGIATLRPGREESVNLDETKHLFIEGNNMEVLDAIAEQEPQRIICLDNSFGGDDDDASKPTQYRFLGAKTSNSERCEEM